jgi:hypothetical protein
VKFKNFPPVFLIDDDQSPELYPSGPLFAAGKAQFDRHLFPPSANPHRHPPIRTGPQTRQAPANPTSTRKKKTPFRGPLNFFVLNDLLILFLLHLVDQGFKSVIEGLFERLGRTFYEEVMLGNMNSDLRNLVFDGVNYIVQLQEHINFDNSVMERV